MESTLGKIKKYLEDKVKFAFVYGSVLTKYFRNDSDIDVAIFLNKRIDATGLLKFQNDMSKHFDHKYEFDIVLLDTADPIISMQVLANRKLIVDNDRTAFITYKARMISQYIDFKRDRKIIEDRLAEGSIYD